MVLLRLLRGLPENRFFTRLAISVVPVEVSFCVEGCVCKECACRGMYVRNVCGGVCM